MSGSGALVTGVISLVLTAGSIVAALLNRATHHPKRSIFFIVIAVLFLIAAIYLLIRGLRPGSAQASK